MGNYDCRTLNLMVDMVSVATALYPDRSTWNSMISQAVAICCLTFYKLKAHAGSHGHKNVAKYAGASTIQKQHNSISEG